MAGGVKQTNDNPRQAQEKSPHLTQAILFFVAAGNREY